MRPRSLTGARALRAWLPGAALLLLAVGCTSTGSPRAPPAGAATPVVDRDTAAAVVMATTIQTLQRLAQAQPAEQAEIISNARQAYERSPGGEAQLRYALVLAVPGTSVRDTAMAQTLLRQLAAVPESLLPAERALTLLELAQLDRELDLQQDNDRVQAEANLHSGRDRLVAAQRRLQAEMDDNARLRKQLDDAQAKLDAIAKIERNITERKSGTESRKP